MNLEEYRQERARRNLEELSLEDIQKKEKKKSLSRARIRRQRLMSLMTFFLGLLFGALLSFGGYGVYRQITNPSKMPARIVMDEYSMGEIDTMGEISAMDNAQEVLAKASKNSQGTISADDENALKILQQSLESGEGTLAALRKAFRNQIMVVSEGEFYFKPIDPGLTKNDYDDANLFYDDNGRLRYKFEDGSISKIGIDVSKYQGEIDWEKVKNDDIDFAIIRGGIRGYGTGKVVPEEDFVRNALAASGQGMEIGVYFFSQAVTQQEAIEEADCVIEALSGNEISYPIVYDLERVSGGRMAGMDSEQITDCALAFCNRVKEAGYTPMIYGNLETFILMLNMNRLEDIDKWFSYYNNDIYFPYKHRLWQYTELGVVDGIEGYVDMNVGFY